jgi:hypothetical protein
VQSYFIALLTNGAIYWRLPISAFVQRGSGATLHQGQMEHQDIEDLELWNSFSYYPSVTTFDFLVGQRCKYLGKDKKFIHGQYLFTVDWAHPEPNIIDTEHSEIPDQHKCAHILALDNGNYAAQPNNRILWSIPSFTTSTHWPDYKVQTTEWNVENKDWKTDDTDDMFYQVEDKKMSSEFKLSDQTQVSLPVKNIIAIVSAVVVAVWTYFGIVERLK